MICEGEAMALRGVVGEGGMCLANSARGEAITTVATSCVPPMYSPHTNVGNAAALRVMNDVLLSEPHRPT